MDSSVDHAPSLRPGVKEGNSDLTDTGLNLPPVARIPFEVLEHIFAFQTIIDPSVTPSMIKRCGQDGWLVELTAQEKLGWIKITHVCRLWRHVALSRPELWVYVSLFLGPEWRDEFVSRSKQLPIVLDCTKVPKAVDYQELIVRHIHRIKQLGIGGITQRAPFLEMPAPHLEKLEFFPSPEFSPIYTFPDQPFCNFAPKLKHLALKGCSNFCWDSPIVNNLTYLEYCGDRNKPTLTTLLSTLSRMPRLEHLRLSWCLPSDKRIKTEQTIEFPCLESLDLAGMSSDCVAVFKRLKFPAAARLYMYARLTDGEGRVPRVTPPLVVPYLSTHFEPLRGASRFPIFHLEGFEHEICVKAGKTLSASWTDPEAELARYSYRADLDLNLGWPTEGRKSKQPATFIKRVMEALPLGGVRILRVHTPYSMEWGPQTWRYLCDDEKHVEHVDVVGPSALYLPRALADSQPGEEPLFQRLRSITFLWPPRGRWDDSEFDGAGDDEEENSDEAGSEESEDESGSEEGDQDALEEPEGDDGRLRGDTKTDGDDHDGGSEPNAPNASTVLAELARVIASRGQSSIQKVFFKQHHHPRAEIPEFIKELRRAGLGKLEEVVRVEFI